MDDELTSEQQDELDQAYYESQLDKKQNGAAYRPSKLTPEQNAEYDAMAKQWPGKSIGFVLDKIEQARKLEAKKPPIINGAAMAAALPEVPYLIRGLGMVAGGGAPDLTAGFGFSGKTVALQALLLACAADVPVWGLHPPEPDLRVIHVDLEQGERLTVRRYQRLAAARGIRLESLGDRLMLSSMPGIQLGEAYRDQWLWLMEKRSLMVVDSVRAAMAGVDENDARVRDGIDYMGGLSSQTGCRVHFVHHARKPFEGGQNDGRFSIRGSGAIYDAVDGAWLFSANKGEPVMVEHVKARSHGEPTEGFALQIVDVELMGDPKAGLDVRVQGVEAIEAIRSAKRLAKSRLTTVGQSRDLERVIRAESGITVSDARTKSGLSGANFYKALELLGASVQTREEKRGRVIVKCLVWIHAGSR